MTFVEHFTQPEQDPFTEACMYDSFDRWLTQIPQERLRYLHEVSVQACGEEGARDTETLTSLVSITLFFSGKQTMSILDVTHAFQKLTTYMKTEIHVRAGDMTKEGIYSIVPEENIPMITKDVYGPQGD